MKPDHEAAKKWAEEILRLDSVLPLGKIGNAAACYLDLEARLAKAEKERDEARAWFDKATELLASVVAGDDDYSVGCACKRCATIPAFLAAERK